jgi:hypothetical protein
MNRRDTASLGLCRLGLKLTGFVRVMVVRVMVVGVMVVGVMVAAGCGQGQIGSGQPGAGVTPGPSATSPSATVTPGATDAVTFGSDTIFGTSRTGGTMSQMTVRGHIQAGVEAGCMILNADGGAVYLLLGGDRQVINAGGRVEVVGEPQPGLMTTCQQGIPFQVAQVRTI